MRVLFIFVDGIGLGDDDPAINPFVVANIPTLNSLSNGKPWITSTGRQESERAIFLPVDPRMGVPGRPQSGSSQAAILTGRNVPAIIDRHYGPKPDETTRHLISQDNIFKQVVAGGKKAALINAYPPGLLASIARGKTLPSSIQQAAIEGGQTLFTLEDLKARRALTAEWTGKEWRDHIGIPDAPLYTPQEAGRIMVAIARQYDFAFHSHWLTDYIGHRGPVEQAVSMLERLDGVIAGVLETWQDDEGLIIITSDHGNMERIGDRRHTENDVPCVIIGGGREQFAEGLTQLIDFTPKIASYLFT